MAAKKVLCVLTSDATMGWFLPELVHPYVAFKAAGYEVTIASITGGATTASSSSLEGSFYDEESKAFWEGEGKALTENTVALDTIDGTAFDCVFFVGGFGTMLDFPFAPSVDKVGREVYENGGVVGAVCHGPIAFANIKLSNGELLIKGKGVAGFSNAEEAAMGLLDKLPEHEGKGKSCEDVLAACGATYTCGDAWGSHVVSNDRVVTGQNPGSAAAVGAAIVAALSA